MTGVSEAWIELFEQWSAGADNAALKRLLQGIPAAEQALADSLLEYSDRPGPASSQRLAEQLAHVPDGLSQVNWQLRPGLRQALSQCLQQACSSLATQPALALILASQILHLEPDQAEAWFLRGQLYVQAEVWPAAVADFARARRLQPTWAAPWQEEARALMLQGKPQAGLALLQEGLQRMPDQLGLWLFYGNLCLSTDQPVQAEAAYRQALSLNPWQTGIWLNLALICQAQLRLEEAVVCLQKALATPDTTRPDSRQTATRADIWYRLASLQLRLNQPEAAAVSLGHCLKLQPEHYLAWVYQGLLADLQGQPDQMKQAFARAISLDPQRPEAWLEAATLCLRQGQEEGLRLLERGIEVMQPGAAHATLQMVLGRTLAIRNQPAAGNALMQAALEQQPEQRFWCFLAGLGCPTTYVTRPRTERQQYLRHLEAQLETWSASPFHPATYLQESVYLPLETLWNLIYLDEGPLTRIKALFGQCFLPAAPRPDIRQGQGPLRLGVVVTAGHEGPFVLNAARMLRALPDTCCDLLVLGNPTLLAASGLRTQALAPTPREAAAQLRALKLDLIYYWEVGSDALNFLLPYFRPAPVQFTSWGVAATTGLPVMDYYLSSACLEPAGAQAHYTEHLLLMDHMPLCGSEPPLPQPLRSRTELGLPASGTLYICLQNLMKFTPEFGDILVRLLAAEPDSHLILQASQPPWLHQAVASWEPLEAFRNRLHWLQAPFPRAQLLNLIAVADVGLDTLVCSGGQTSHDALALGLPLVAWEGPAQHSRLTAGYYRQLGLADAIVSDPEAYLQQARALANPAIRQQLKTRIQAQRERLLSLEPATQFAELLWEMARRKGLR